MRAMVLALAAVMACRRAAPESEPEPGPPKVHCEALRPATFHVVRTLRGSVQLPPERLARVAAQVPGRVLRLAVREGDAVHAGQLVAEIEASPFVEMSTAARGGVETSRLALTAATATVQRLTALVARGVASQQELDDARVREAEARAALAQRTAGASAVRRELARTRLLAPVAGVVLRVLRGAGELVDGTPGTPVVEVGDPSAVAFAGNALAEDLAALAHDQEASVIVGAADETPWPARVDRVALAVDPATGVGTAWLRPDPARALPVGITGVARVRVSERTDALTVPEGALRERDGEHAEVVLCVEHKAKVREVRVGDSEDGRVLVLEGLAAGDRVVREHAIGLEDDAEVEEEP